MKQTLLSAFPEIAKEWHPTKNGELTPDKVSQFSPINVIWFLPYDDPVTGKHFDFEWEATVYHRTKTGTGCPYLSNRKVCVGYNDLATRFPELVKEWHPTKNNGLTPQDFTFGSRKKVWWVLTYDDPNTGKQFIFEWDDYINSRTLYGRGCPYLSGDRIYPGFNDFKTEFPDIAAEWHPTKNLPLTPSEISSGSGSVIWWFLPYDDPKTGKHFDFEWPASLYARTIQGQGCPYLSGKAVWGGFNDLATTHPDIAAEWHPTKNGDLTPQMVTYGSGKKVWWLLHYDDPITGKSFDFEWQAYIVNRTILKNDCPFLSGKAVCVGFNDLATTHPDIAAEWHPTKNGKLTPKMVTYGSNKKVWWLLHYDDPITGKSFDFEWPAKIETRVDSGCPYISGNAVWKGYNDLKTRYPEIAAQWHPTKNGNITPDMVLPGSPKTYWWIFPYDDPITGKHFDFEWPASIGERVQAKGCPFLSGQRVWIGYNDFASLYPDIAKQWHPTKNNGLTPYDVPCGSALRVWWLFPYDDPKTGKHFDFEWQAPINSRQSTGCPFLSSTNPRAWPGFNDLATVNPEIAKEWHPSKNRKAKPSHICNYSNKKYWWLCKACGNIWYASVYSRTKQGTGCSKCNKVKIYY